MRDGRVPYTIHCIKQFGYLFPNKEKSQSHGQTSGDKTGPDCQVCPFNLYFSVE